MITEDCVSFETAKLLKEKGFNIPCDNYYDSSGKTPNESVYGGANIETLDYNTDPFVKSGFLKFKTFSAPTQSMAMKWLREVHKILITIIPQEVNVGIDRMCYGIYRITEDSYIPLYNGKVDNLVNSYEKVVEAAIKYVLENLI